MPARGESIGVIRPDLIPRWSPKNTHSILEISAASKDRFFWICKNDHEFRVSNNKIVNDEILPCPQCLGKKASSENNLVVSDPEVALLFHSIKNSVDPVNVLSRSNHKFWWQCTEDETHEWILSPHNMVKRREKCNFCSNKELSNTNSLAVMRPELAVEFDVARNKITPDLVIANQSRTVYWWKCQAYSHSWSTRLDTRINHGWGCPFCANRYVSPQNNLQVLFPEIAKEFDIDANDCSPKDVIGTSDTHYAWKCIKNHQWTTAISTRTVMGTGCPYCVNQRVHSENSLAYLFPKIAKEYHSENEIVVTEIGGCSAKIVSWRCDKDHVWRASVASRTFANSGCPKCVRTTVSAIEKSFREEFEKLAILTQISSETLDIKWGKSNLLRPDFYGYFGDRKVVVEYDGSYFHKDKQDKDILKTKALLDNGWVVVRIREQTPAIALDDLEYSHARFSQIKHSYRKDDAISVYETTEKIRLQLNRMMSA